MAELFPWAKTDDLMAGFHVPGDGRVNPVDATTALAKGARQLGVRIVEGVSVEDVLVDRGRATGVRVRTGASGETTEIEAEYVVNCAGMWARELGARNGLVIPNQAAEHYYLITDTIDGLDPDAPVFEDPASYGYYREEGGGMMVGLFEPKALLPFYEETWGLTRVGRTAEGSILLRANGPEHHVLALVPGDGHSREGVHLGASSTAYVDELAAEIGTGGTEIVRGPGQRPDVEGGGYGVTFLDPERRRVEVSHGVTEHAGDDQGPHDHGPDRLSHIVLNSVDVPASQAFYVGRLGFSVSDTYEDDLMIFLRCNALHHCIVLAPGEWTSLNHVAFEVESAEEVMKSLGRMRAAGFETIWGPGRHGPGGNVFCYFSDPVGNVIEYTAELLELDDTWEPQVWARTQENADVWGTSGGITPEVIKALANPPPSAQEGSAT